MHPYCSANIKVIKNNKEEILSEVGESTLYKMLELKNQRPVKIIFENKIESFHFFTEDEHDELIFYRDELLIDNQLEFLF